MMLRVLPALVIVVAANVAMLAGVAANRSGEPDAVIIMTERELPLRFTNDRNSARQLTVRIDRTGTIFLPWLRRQKLEALGFEFGGMPQADTAVYSRQLPRRAFVVLEYDGPAWQSYVSELRRRREVMEQQADEVRRGVRAQNAVTEQYVPNVEEEQASASRLLPIDAGTDAAALRRAYPDRRLHIIAPATIRPQFDYRPSADRVAGSISLVTQSLVVPREWRGVLDNLGAADYGVRTSPARYTVKVAYGSRHEPWITSIDGIDTPRAPH